MKKIVTRVTTETTANNGQPFGKKVIFELYHCIVFCLVYIYLFEVEVLFFFHGFSNNEILETKTHKKRLIPEIS